MTFFTRDLAFKGLRTFFLGAVMFFMNCIFQVQVLTPDIAFKADQWWGDPDKGISHVQPVTNETLSAEMTVKKVLFD